MEKTENSLTRIFIFMFCTSFFLACNMESPIAIKSLKAEKTSNGAKLMATNVGVCDFNLDETTLTATGWTKIFDENNLTFEAPKLVLFSGQVQTACGGASSASGPFYCPGDKVIYMDMTFFEELRTKFGAEGGDFAVAYVLAHEFGHHIQTILGTSSKVRQLQENRSETEANKLSVALELQADFYAGLWTHYNEKQNAVLDPGDIEEALSAANAVGDDAIQKKMQGQVVPDSFTHGTSEQRMYWFNRGFKSGDINKGDTFAELN